MPGKAFAESLSGNTTVLIRVVPQLTLSMDKKDIAADSKSAATPKNEDYTRQTKDNTVLYTMTE